MPVLSLTEAGWWACLQRYRQHVRDLIIDLVKAFLDCYEDGDDAVSAAAYLALDNILDLGNPRLMASQVADFLGTSDQVRWWVSHLHQPLPCLPYQGGGEEGVYRVTCVVLSLLPVSQREVLSLLHIYLSILVVDGPG